MVDTYTWGTMTKLKILFFIFFCNAYAKSMCGWEQSHYIWNFGLISASNRGFVWESRDYFTKEPIFNKQVYDNLKAGDIVWVKCCFMQKFCDKILPVLNQSIVVLIADGDESFPSDCGKDCKVENLINNQFITHVFAQNCDYCGESKKVSHIPIGLDFHTIAYKGNRGGWGEIGSVKEQECVLNNILKTLKPTYLRKRGAFVDFQHSDTMRSGFKRYLQFGEDRRTIFQRLLPTGLINYSTPMRRSKLWATKGEYAFSISPHGNGLDCHRTWEDLVLGCIVIVKTSPLDRLYEGLPVVIVKDWNEITSKNLDKWIVQYGDAFTNPVYREKLTLNYWLAKIREKTQFSGGVNK